MSSAWFFAWAYTKAHRGRTLLLIAALGLVLLLPSAFTVMVRSYDARLGARAADTPVVIGARGNRYDLVLQALVFRDGRTRDVAYAWVGRVADDRVFDAQAIPIHARHTAEGFAVVGTDIAAYLAFRELAVASGSAPDMLGEAVLGWSVAAELGLEVGDTLTTDRVNLYDLSRAMPLQMRIVGVLEPSRGVDDRAIFVDVRTAWIIAGLGHGHDPSAHADPALHSAAKTEIIITPDNADLFHFHEEDQAMPLSAVIALPATQKDQTLLLSRINSEPLVQALVPARVVDELMGLVLRIKRLFDANSLLVGVSAGLLLWLVLALSLKLRAAERRTLHRLGCPKRLVGMMLAAELTIVLCGATVVAAIGAGCVLLLAPRMLGM